MGSFSTSGPTVGSSLPIAGRGLGSRTVTAQAAQNAFITGYSPALGLISLRNPLPFHKGPELPHTKPTF